jgi:hypothetical protein
MDSTFGIHVTAVDRLPAEEAQSSSGESEKTNRQLNLGDLLNERKKLYQQLCGTGIVLSIHSENRLDPVTIPTFDMDRLLLNLLLVAKHKMPFGGKLRLETSHVNLGSRVGRRVKLTLETKHNLPDETTPAAMPKYWNSKLAQQIITQVISSSGAMLTVCELSEAATVSEVLFPARAAAA